MHQAPRRVLVVFRSVLVVAIALSGLIVAPATAADVAFTGGPIPQDTPQFIPNDHTAQAIRFGATGLTPGAVYEVKVRLSPNTAPASTENRGFTWNPAGQTWSRNRGVDWGASNFPTVTADVDGNIVVSPWMYFKFGNEANSGLYYIIVTLNSGGDGFARNATVMPAVTVLDMDANGTRLHNGTAAVTTTNGLRQVVAAPGSSTNATATAFTITQNEPNLVDDDSDGTVDDENWWSPSANGGYSVAVPVTSTIDIWIAKSTPTQFDRKCNDGVPGNADEDISLGASDTVAPAAPTELAAVSSQRRVDLTWASSASSDTAYYKVYRWTDTNSTEYTNAHQLIGETTATTFVDASTVVGGIDYHYEVRSVDTSTNVSARSPSATAKSVGMAPSMQVPAFSTDVTTTRSFAVSWAATDSVAEMDYELEYGTSAGRMTLMTGGTSANMYGNLGQTYNYRVRGYDGVGNVTAWSSIYKVTVPYDQSSLRYSSGWRTASSPNVFNGSLKYTYTSGASATMSFTGGTRAYLVTSTGTNRGKVKVYVDGRYKRTLNLYSAAPTNRAKFYLASFTGSGKHTVKLVQLSSGSRKRIDIDGLAVVR